MLPIIMSEYASETEQQLLIWRQRSQASDVALTPTNVRRVYSDLRSPRRPTQRAVVQLDDDEPDRILSSLFNTGASATMTAGVGVGTATPITVSAGMAPVGVRAPLAFAQYPNVKNRGEHVGVAVKVVRTVPLVQTSKSDGGCVKRLRAVLTENWGNVY